eukprot:2509837-Prymnesium_polylepis.1
MRAGIMREQIHTVGTAIALQAGEVHGRVGNSTPVQCVALQSPRMKTFGEHVRMPSLQRPCGHRIGWCVGQVGQESSDSGQIPLCRSWVAEVIAAVDACASQDVCATAAPASSI